MDQENTLMFSSLRPKASGAFPMRMTEGKVAVEMLREERVAGAIFLPDSVQGYERADVGVVVGAGPDVDLEAGQAVLVLPYDGKHIDDFEMGEYRAGQVRLFGDISANGITRRFNYWRSIIAILDYDSFTIKPLGTMVLIKRAKAQEKSGAIYLPDSEQYRDSTAEVIAVGPLVEDVRVGDMVLYHVGGIKETRYGKEFCEGMGASEDDLAFIDEANIYCVAKELQSA